MPANPEAPSELDRVISDYLLVTETGQDIGIETFCESHPDYAEGIRAFFYQSEQLISYLERELGTDQLHVEGYELLREIGRGGMGVVFEARQSSLGRNVAIKVLRDGALSSESARSRFDTEARLIAQLDHEAIVSVLEFGEVDGRPYLVMPLVDGHALSQAIREEPFGERVAAKIMVRVADAIEHAHQQGVIHRDIKPANIVGDVSTCQVMDFGLAIWDEGGERVSQTGDILGTPGYQAPEILRGGSRGDVATDIYSMGATLYALLIGQAPHTAATAAQSMLLAMRGDPVSPRQMNSTLSTDINSITLRCLHSDPATRYQSSAELKADLQSLLEGRPVVARPVTRLERVRRWAVRNQGLATAIVTAVVLAVGLLAGGVYSYRTISNSLDKQSELTKASNKSLRGSIRAVRDFYGKVGSAAAFEDTDETIALRKELLRDGVTFLNEFLEENAEQPELQLEVANSHLLLSRLYKDLGDSNNTIASAVAAEAVFSKLSTRDKSPEVTRGYAACLMEIGSAHMQAGEFEKADTYYRRAVGVSESLAELENAKPDLAMLHYQCQFAVFRSMERSGDRVESIAGGEKVLPAIDRIAAANPADASILFAASQAHGWYGVMQHRSGPSPGKKKKTAAQHYTRGYDFATAAMKIDPENERYQLQAAGCAGNLVFFAHDVGNITPDLFEKQLAVNAIFQSLADRHPGNPLRQYELLKAKEHACGLATAMKRPEARKLALENLQEIDEVLAGTTIEANPGLWNQLHATKQSMFSILADIAASDNDIEAEACYLSHHIEDLNLQLHHTPEDLKLVRYIAHESAQLANAYAKLGRNAEVLAARGQSIKSWVKHGLRRPNELGILMTACSRVRTQLESDPEASSELSELVASAIELVEERAPVLLDGGLSETQRGFIAEIKATLKKVQSHRDARDTGTSEAGNDK